MKEISLLTNVRPWWAMEFGQFCHQILQMACGIWQNFLWKTVGPNY